MFWCSLTCLFSSSLCLFYAWAHNCCFSYSYCCWCCCSSSVHPQVYQLKQPQWLQLWISLATFTAPSARTCWQIRSPPPVDTPSARAVWTSTSTCASSSALSARSPWPPNPASTKPSKPCCESISRLSYPTWTSSVEKEAQFRATSVTNTHLKPWSPAWSVCSPSAMSTWSLTSLWRDSRAISWWVLWRSWIRERAIHTADLWSSSADVTSAASAPCVWRWVETWYLWRPREREDRWEHKPVRKQHRSIFSPELVFEMFPKKSKQFN